MHISTKDIIGKIQREVLFHLSVKMGCEVARCCTLIVVHCCVIYECHPLTHAVKAKRFKARMVNLPPRRHRKAPYILAVCHSCLFSFLTNQVI